MPLTAFPLVWRILLEMLPALLLIGVMTACAPTDSLHAAIILALGWVPVIALAALFGVGPLQLWWRALSERRTGRPRNVGHERDDLDYAGRMFGFLGYAMLQRSPLQASAVMVGYGALFAAALYGFAGWSVAWVSTAASTCVPPPAQGFWVGAMLLVVAAFEGLFWPALVRRLGHARRIYGLRQALRGMWLMLKLRTRQPARDLRINLPGANAFWYGLVFSVVLLYGGSMKLVLAAGLICTVGALSSALKAVLPPTLLLLSVTGERQFLLMRFLARVTPGFAVTLIDQRSPTLHKVYFWYYGELRRHMRKHARGVAKLLPSASGLALNPSGPRTDNLRTRPGYWRKSVRDVVAFVPWVIVDTREGSPHVDAEMVWILQGEHVGKALFVTGDDGEQQALKSIRDMGIDPLAQGARVVTLTAMDTEIFAVRDKYGR